MPVLSVLEVPCSEKRCWFLARRSSASFRGACHCVPTVVLFGRRQFSDVSESLHGRPFLRPWPPCDEYALYPDELITRLIKQVLGFSVFRCLYDPVKSGLRKCYEVQSNFVLDEFKLLKFVPFEGVEKRLVL